MRYTGRATADGDGRNGHVATDDNLLDLKLGIPRELGGAGGGSNPEQLFAAAYAGCFLSALGLVARQRRVKLIDATVTAEVTATRGEDGFGLSVVLTVGLPGASTEDARELLDGAHARCPFSKAVRGNVPVELRFTNLTGSSKLKRLVLYLA